MDDHEYYGDTGGYGHEDKNGDGYDARAAEQVGAQDNVTYPVYDVTAVQMASVFTEGTAASAVPVASTAPASPAYQDFSEIPADSGYPQTSAAYATADFSQIPAASYVPPVPPSPPLPAQRRRRRSLRPVVAVICCVIIMLGCGFVGAKINEARMKPLLDGTESMQVQNPGANVAGNNGIPGDAINGNADVQSDNNSSDTDSGSSGENDGDNNSDNNSDNNHSALTGFNTNGSTLSLTDLFTGANPAVVAISTETTGYNVFGRRVTLPAAGSGFIISADGYIVTNNHVIEDANSISVLLYDGNKHQATLVGRDPNSDVAVLKIDAQGLSYLSWGASDALKVGEQVAAIGNPLGEFANSMTVGYISALNREINIDGTPRNMLQTDAAVNEGNSGGPLLNMMGQIIGIVSAKSVGMSVEGLGFAIPSNEAKAIVDLLIRDGYVKGRAVMGVTVGLDDEDGATFVYVVSVNPGSAAEKAGVKEDDVILSANRKAVSTIEELKDVIATLSPGDELALKIRRGNENISLTVILDEYKPPEPETSDRSGNRNPNSPGDGNEMPFDPRSIFPELDDMFPQDGGYYYSYPGN